MRIANFGLAATNERITSFASPADVRSLSDFHALVFDPDFIGQAINSQMQSMASEFRRKVFQVSELLNQKAGAVICMLRPNQVLANLSMGNIVYQFNKYFLLDDVVIAGSRPFPFDSITAGMGDSYELSATATVAGRKYFRTLQGHLQFHAHFSGASSEAVKQGKVIAHDSVGHPIAAQFDAGNGKVLFLPVPHNVASDQVGGCIVETVGLMLRGEPEIQEPEWAEKIVVPTSTVHDSQIAELQEQQKRIREELNRLGQQKAELIRYKRLLFGTGKAILEPAVRSAFRLLGFEVPEPEQYSGDWDAELRLQDGRTCLAEIEGAEGVVSVDKFRQLHHYLGEEVLEGRNHKGILVGNGFRLQEPSTRPNQFSDHVMSAASKFDICVLPSTELYKAICAVLENSEDYSLRSQIRDSILKTTGSWGFSV